MLQIHFMATSPFYANIRAFFFDMDGVLFDSMPAHAGSWQKAFATFGINYEPYNAYLNEGRTGKSTISDVFKKHLHRVPQQNELDDIYNLKTAIFESYPESPAVKGIEDVIGFLNNKGYDLWIVTGSSQKTLLQKIEHTFGNVFGSNMISGNDVTHGKPNPEPYEKALKRANIQAREAIVIENAPLGILSSKGAGIFTIGINTGILEPEILYNAGADIVFSDAKSLLQWLQENFQ